MHLSPVTGHEGGRKIPKGLREPKKKKWRRKKRKREKGRKQDTRSCNRVPLCFSRVFVAPRRRKPLSRGQAGTGDRGYSLISIFRSFASSPSHPISTRLRVHAPLYLFLPEDENGGRKPTKTGAKRVNTARVTGRCIGFEGDGVGGGLVMKGETAGDGNRDDTHGYGTG